MKRFSKVVFRMLALGFLLTLSSTRLRAQDSSPAPDNTKVWSGIAIPQRQGRSTKRKSA